MKRETAERLKGARWSSTTRCARMGAYTALGAVPAPHSEYVAGMFERGHDLEDVFARRLAMDYTGPIEREVAIKWGDGWELHCDFLLPEDARRHLEVKSNTNINALPGPELELAGVRSKSPVLQVVGAATFDPEGGSASVAVMSPTTYLHREYQIEINDDLTGMVRELEQRVVHALTTGELPDRVCKVPSDAVGRFCPHRDTCFADWELAETREPADAAVSLLAAQLRAAEDEYREAKTDLAELEQQRAELRRQVRDYTKPGVEYDLGGVRVRRTISKRGRRTFKLTDALATGALPAGDIDGPLSRLGNYVSESEPQERWTVGDALEDDLGG